MDALAAFVDSLPLHGQLMFAILCGSALLCLLVAGMAPLRRLYPAAPLPAGLPPLPEALPPRRFPTVWDAILTALFLAFIFYSAVEMCKPQEEDAMLHGMDWWLMSVSIAVQAGIYIPLLVRYAIACPPKRPSRPWQQYILLPLALWAGLFTVMLMLEHSGLPGFIVEHTGCPEQQQVVESFSKGSLPMKVFIAVSAVVIAPIGEEICFRGFLFRCLRAAGGFWPAAIATGLLFGAIHSSLAQMIPLTLFGIVLCVAYERVRSLWLPIAVHAIFNTVSLITTYFFYP